MFLTIIIFIITLLTLVVVHELGHFLVAKKFNIKVLEFGFGFPPRIWGKKIGETVLSFNWLPIGGFVRLLGEDGMEAEGADDKRSFIRAHVNKRIAVVVAGVIMNLFLAWVLLYIVIVSQGFKIFLPTPTPEVIISKVEIGSPASAAGLVPGDRIISVNGKKLNDLSPFAQIIKDNAGVPTQIQVGDIYGGSIREITIIPRTNPPTGQGALGVATAPFAVKEFKGTLEKIFSAPIYSYQIIKVTILGFGDLFSNLFAGNFSKASSQVSGPIGLVVASNDILSGGVQAIMLYLFFVGYLSLSLAFINIIPFPALDGGRLMFLVVEALTKRRVHPEIERRINTAGMAILLLLVALVTYSDISKLH